MQVGKQIGQFLIDNGKWSESAAALTDDYPLIENDILDSMGIFETVSYIQEQFGISVEDEDLVPENFQSISAIADLVTKRSVN